MVSEPDLPTRSLDGRNALDIFYEDFNDVNFFVEDEDQENLYEVVLRAMFPELRIARIFPLGGKRSVIARALQRDQPSAPKVVCLVDKDFDDLLGAVQEHPQLFYLDRYCIENYLFEEVAVLEVVVESQPKLRRTAVRQSLDLDSFVPNLMESLRPLFQLFFCVQLFSLQLHNCSLSIERFCKPKRRWVVDADAVAAYESDVVKAASQTEHARRLAAPLKCPEIEALAGMDLHAVVSGKHACALIFNYLKSKYSLGSITFESFLFRLAKNCSLSGLERLSDEIRSSLAATR